MLTFVNLDERVPPDHPLRIIKRVADDVLDRMSDTFDRMYSRVGRASVLPECLLKSLLLISLYSIRSERAFCQEFGYNLLYRWFLDMDLTEPSFDATVFAKNRRRLLRQKAGRILFKKAFACSLHCCRGVQFDTVIKPIGVMLTHTKVQL